MQTQSKWQTNRSLLVALPIALVAIGIAVFVARSARETAGPNRAPSALEPLNSIGADAFSPSSDIASGSIEVAPELADRSKQIGVVYVILRSAAGGPPYAVSRIENPRGNAPIPFRLTAQNIMAQGSEMPADAVLVVRFDADGVAGPEAVGDLVGETKVPNPGKTDLAVLVNREGGQAAQ